MIIIKNDQSFFPTLNNNISKLIFIRVPEEFNLIFVPISIQNLLSSPLKHFSHYYVLIIEDLYRRYLEKKITRTHQKITYLNYRINFANSTRYIFLSLGNICDIETLKTFPRINTWTTTDDAWTNARNSSIISPHHPRGWQSSQAPESTGRGRVEYKTAWPVFRVNKFETNLRVIGFICILPPVQRPF